MSIEDILVRRQIFIQRFSSSQARIAQGMLADLFETINARIFRATTDFQLQRLTIVQADIRILLSRGFSEIREFIIKGAFQLSEAEMKFSTAAMQSGTSVRLSLPALAQIEQAVLMQGMDTPIGPGTLSLTDAMNIFSSNKTIDITRLINNGILLGDTTKNIIRDLVRLLEKQHRSQIETLVRTSINHAASMARRAMVMENAAILDSEEWISTLDIRTTLICAGRDGRRYPVGLGPYPPAHWNCRSVRVPIVKDEFSLGIRSVRRPEKGAKGASTTTGQTRFDGWMRRQPADFQDEYFSQFPDGLEKAKLFRIGKLEIDRFRDETGRNFTLEQLEALEPIAFGKAGLIPPPI